MNQRLSGFVYTAERGDTLYALGKRYGIPLSALIYGNPCMNVYDMREGDQIFIPGRRKNLKKM